MVDALVSGTSVSNDVQVRVLFWARIMYELNEYNLERWRNWQTRYFEGVVTIVSWEFESPPLHLCFRLHSDMHTLRKQLSWQSTTLPRLGSRVRVSFSALNRRQPCDMFAWATILFLMPFVLSLIYYNMAFMEWGCRQRERFFYYISRIL